MSRPDAMWTLVAEKEGCYLIRDIGHLEGRRTITNDAEEVVAEVHRIFNLGERRLFYIDSDGDIDELLHTGRGEFTGFGQGSGPFDRAEYKR